MKYVVHCLLALEDRACHPHRSEATLMMHLVNLFTHSAVLTSLVLVVVIVLFIIETFSPHTFGLVGLLATGVLAGIVYAYQSAGIGYWFGPLLMLIGVALVVIEALGIHLHGVLMMLGATAIGAGLFYALGAGANAGIATSAGVAASFCALFYTFKMLPLSPFWLKSGAGNVLRLHTGQSLQHIDIGCQCIATSDLRPCGMVMIGENRIPARSINGFVRNASVVYVSEVRKHEVLVTIDRM